MTNRQALIEKLIVFLHLNVPERELLGSDSLSVEEIAAAVKLYLSAMACSRHKHDHGSPEKRCSRELFC